MVNIGKSAGFFPGNLMELVNRNINGPKPEIGRIDLMPGYTLFDVRREDAHRVLDALRHADFFGDKIRAEVAQPGKDYASESSDRPSRGGRGKAKGKGDYKKDSRSRKPRKDEKSDKKAKAKTKGKSKEKSKKPKYNGNYDIFMK